MKERVAFLNLLLFIVNNSMTSQGLIIRVPHKYFKACISLSEIEQSEDLLPTYYSNSLSKVRLELYIRLKNAKGPLIFKDSVGSRRKPLQNQTKYRPNDEPESHEIDIGLAPK